MGYKFQVMLFLAFYANIANPHRSQQILPPSNGWSKCYIEIVNIESFAKFSIATLAREVFLQAELVNMADDGEIDSDDAPN